VDYKLEKMKNHLESGWLHLLPPGHKLRESGEIKVPYNLKKGVEIIEDVLVEMDGIFDNYISLTRAISNHVLELEEFTDRLKRSEYTLTVNERD